VSPAYVLNPDGLLFDGGQYRWSKARVGRAWQQTRQDFARLVRAGKSLVLDATSVLRSDREDYVSAARGAGYRVIAVWFDVPREVLVARDSSREDAGKRVGAEVIQRFVGDLEPPSLVEGFDEVWTVGPDGEVRDRAGAASAE
jgi:predicted kinase